MSKTQTPQVAGCNKYLPLSSLLSPFSIPAWSAGLQAINQSPSLLVEASKSFDHFCHYAFPDLRIFVSPASDEEKAKFIELWLWIHEGCLMRVMNETLLAMPGQNWRNLLSNDLSAIQEKKEWHQGSKTSPTSSGYAGPKIWAFSRCKDMKYCRRTSHLARQ